MREAQLLCRDLNVAVPGRTLVSGLSLEIASGTCLAVLGRNGSGKTTTLHALAGLHECAQGEILIDRRPLRDWPRRKLAQTLGLLMQNYEHPFPSTVLSTALIGRHPHIGLLGWEDAEDVAIARKALAQAGLEGLEEREVATLSGGELRRLAIATVLAQDPSILLLDEPVNHLDLNHQIMVLSLLREKADQGHCVVVSMHDVNLAMRFCDQALLLFGDGRWTGGPVRQVVNKNSLSQLYGTPVAEVPFEKGGLFFPA